VAPPVRTGPARNSRQSSRESPARFAVRGNPSTVKLRLSASVRRSRADIRQGTRAPRGNVGKHRHVQSSVASAGQFYGRVMRWPGGGRWRGGGDSCPRSQRQPCTALHAPPAREARPCVAHERRGRKRCRLVLPPAPWIVLPACSSTCATSAALDLRRLIDGRSFAYAGECQLRRCGASDSIIVSRPSRSWTFRSPWWICRCAGQCANVLFEQRCSLADAPRTPPHSRCPEPLAASRHRSAQC